MTPLQRGAKRTPSPRGGRLGWGFSLLLAVIALIHPTYAQLFDDALGELEDQRATTPGVELTVETPDTGGFCLVYIPTDYDPKRATPLIFCYHGSGGVLTTWPFRQVTKGEGFLIVGMGYTTEQYAKTLREEHIKQELAHFEEAYEVVSSRYAVDENAVFMGGFSQGGYSTTVLGERLLKRLKGLVILGAGRAFVDWNKPPVREINRKPVFFGVGDQDDPHYQRAQQAAEVYRHWGADVTFDVWEGYGHRWDARAPHEIDVWLRKQAFPTGNVPSD
ncbi:MAG: hypothetical protein O3A46_10560 [Candidatus Poribacteria bacterium]|nr:hypothetical protein [Candidatus Poribacteria bacterium]